MDESEADMPFLEVPLVAGLDKVLAILEADSFLLKLETSLFDS